MHDPPASACGHMRGAGQRAPAPSGPQPLFLPLAFGCGFVQAPAPGGFFCVNRPGLSQVQSVKANVDAMNLPRGWGTRKGQASVHHPLAPFPREGKHLRWRHVVWRKPPCRCANLVVTCDARDARVW